MIYLHATLQRHATNHGPGRGDRIRKEAMFPLYEANGGRIMAAWLCSAEVLASFLTVFLLCISIMTANAAGMVTTPIGSYQFNDNAMAIQSDGKIVVAGTYQNDLGCDFAVVRYNSDGSPDTTFSGDGRVVTDFGSNREAGKAMAIQPDGKIVMAGWFHNGSDSDFAVVRYNIDGGLDTSFDEDGRVTTDFGGRSDQGNAVAIQPDGKIVAAGTSDSDFAVTRYNADGSLDTLFGVGGMVSTDISIDDAGLAVALQPDCKIVVAGFISPDLYADIAVIRYNIDGSLDTTFNEDGKVTTDFGINKSCVSGRNIAIQPDGKIVIPGTSGEPFIPPPPYFFADNAFDFAVARYNNDGSLDTSFNEDGKVTTDLYSSNDYGEAVTIQADGKIVIAGRIDNDFAVVRYNVDGSLDTSFDEDGKVTTDVGGSRGGCNAVAIQEDGKIVVAGYSDFDFAVARYNADGSLDKSFGGRDDDGEGNKGGGSSGGCFIGVIRDWFAHEVLLR